jgi:hypothetical protein
LVGTTKVYPGVGADIVMESITLIMALRWALECNGLISTVISKQIAERI